ncbi:MAG: FAD-dependent oxidoreductase [Candidatus Eisenbacteria bacterium]
MSPPGSDPKSHWWSDPPAPFPVLESELDADVLIVGGGITGVTLAYTLVEQGAVVALVDSGPIAGSASGRNAGFLMVASADAYKDQIEFWGRATARAVLETARRSHQRIRGLIETIGIECDYATRGSLRLAESDTEAEDQRASIALLKADGFEMTEVAPADVAAPGIAAGTVAAFLTPEDGELHPVRFLYGVARAAEGRGARLYAHSGLRTASWHAGLWTAQTERGTAQARTLVLCTNAFTPQLCPALVPLIAPRRGQMMSTAPIERTVAAHPTYAQHGYQYWRQLPDGRLLIGGWRDLDFDGETGYSDDTTPTIQAGIEAGLAALVPEGVAIEHRWAGTMGFARDGRPLVGWLDAGHHLAICAGYTGHGMGLAAACTQELTDLLSWRKAPGIACFDPSRFAELREGRDGFLALGKVER